MPAVNLNITKTVNVTVAYIYDLVKYTIIITNHGPSNATEVVSYDKLEDLLEFVSFTASRGDITYNDETGKITVGSLKVNETVVMEITAMVRNNGTIPNVINVTSHENDTDPSNNNASSKNVTALPVTNLTMVKYSNLTGPVNVTSLVKFTINVTNNGPSNATWVVITDELINEFEFINATGNWSRDGQIITWTIPRVDNGTTVSVDLTVRILRDGKFENIAFAKSDENETGVSNKTNVTADPLIDLKVNKTAGTNEINVGGHLTYTIYVVNLGPSDATDVYVTDDLCGLLQFTSFDSNRTGITYDANTGRASIGSLKANETVILYITAKVLAKGIIPNEVKVNGHEIDTDPTNNNYTCKNVTAKTGTPIDLEACDIYYGGDEFLNVTLPSEATGVVNITVNGIPFDNIPLDGGRATLPLFDLGGGDYYVEVVYGGNTEYVANSTMGVFKVLPLVPTIKIEVVDIWHGEIEVLNVTVNAPGTVSITVYGRTITIPLDHQVRTTNVLKASRDKLSYDGKATWVLVGLPVGTYPAYAVYNGNENYTTVSTSDVFHVRDKPSTVIVTADDIHVGEDAVIHIHVGPIDFNGTVDVTVEGRIYRNVPLVNGKASLTVSGLKAGLKHVHVKFAGDILYRSSENTTTFQVLKYKPPVHVHAPTIEVGQNGKITVTVLDDAIGTITIEVNGKTYTQTIKDGKAVFIVPGLEVGVHQIRAYYSGNDKYFPADAIGKIRVTPKDDVANASEHHHDDGDAEPVGLERHATGNPIFALLAVMLALCAIPIRRFKK